MNRIIQKKTNTVDLSLPCGCCGLFSFTGNKECIYSTAASIPWIFAIFLPVKMLLLSLVLKVF